MIRVSPRTPAARAQNTPITRSAASARGTMLMAASSNRAKAVSTLARTSVTKRARSDVRRVLACASAVSRTDAHSRACASSARPLAWASSSVTCIRMRPAMVIWRASAFSPAGAMRALLMPCGVSNTVSNCRSICRARRRASNSSVPPRRNSARPSSRTVAKPSSTCAIAGNGKDSTSSAISRASGKRISRVMGRDVARRAQPWADRCAICDPGCVRGLSEDQREQADHDDQAYQKDDANGAT